MAQTSAQLTDVRPIPTMLTWAMRRARRARWELTELNMNDHQFEVELRIRAYKDQIDGYYLGWPQRENFQPIVPSVKDEAGKIMRERTLELPCYSTFSKDDRERLLSTDPVPPSEKAAT
jgi:hypothetical protein